MVLLTEKEEDTDQTIPMEVYTSQQGGAEGHSWSDGVDDEESWGWQSSRHHKRRRGASDYESNPCNVVPFTLRATTVEKLFNEARAP